MKLEEMLKNIPDLSSHPAVALETTVLTHGMPYPQNVECALACEEEIRKAGAEPYTIGIINEPFNFLDPSSQTLLKHLLTDYVAQTKATLLISSHNLQHTVDISTRIALLEHGCIIRDLDNKNQQAIHELDLYFGS